MARRTEQRRAAVVALYQSDVTGRPAGDLVERGASPFTRELVEGVEADARARSTSRSRGTRAAGRSTGSRRWSATSCAWRVHEMRQRPDVPDEVAIDEAVEAAKELCGADAPGFINGVLGAVLRENGAPA